MSACVVTSRPGSEKDERRCVHSMSARTAMKHAIEIGFPWRAHSTWVAGAHALMARAVLCREETGAGWELSCPRELEASIYLQAMTLNLWPPSDAYGGPVKMIAADPEAPGAPAFANKALAEDFGYDYEAIPGTGHLLQIQKPEECRRAMLAFLGQYGIHDEGGAR